MTSERRIVVIGAGIAGLTVALALQDAGFSEIVVLEQNGPGYGSSSKSAGVVETQYLDYPGVHVRHFGLEYFARFSRDHGMALVRSGYLRLAASNADLELFAESLRIQREFGITDPEILETSEISSRWPRLRLDDRVGAVFGPSDGHIDSYEFVLRAAALFVARGGTLQSGVTVNGAEQHGDGSWSVLSDNGPCLADLVVNAAGPWAKRVARLFGAEMPQNNQLRPKVKLIHEETLEQPLPFVMDYVPGSGTDGIYFRSETPNEIFVGIHTDESIQEEREPEDTLNSAPQEFIDRVTALLPQRLRTPKGLTLGRTWTGLYAISPDNKPIVSEHPSASNVIHVMGAGGSGVQLAPAMAQMAAELAAGGSSTSFPHTDWSLARFNRDN